MAFRTDIHEFLKNIDTVLEGKDILSAIDIDKLDKPIDEKLDMVQILHKYSSSIDFKKLILKTVRKAEENVAKHTQKKFSIDQYMKYKEEYRKAIEFAKKYIKEDEKIILLEEGINRKKLYENIK